MKKLARCLVVLVVISLIGGASAMAKPPKKPDKKPDKKPGNQIVGTTWSFTAKKQGDSAAEEMTGQFRVYNHVIYKAEKKVGEVKPNGPTETTFSITDFPKLNGSVTLRKVGQKPAIWKGTLDHSDGTKWAMTVTVKET
jgi:hypothetical protein